MAWRSLTANVERLTLQQTMPSSAPTFQLLDSRLGAMESRLYHVLFSRLVKFTQKHSEEFIRLLLGPRIHTIYTMERLALIARLNGRSCTVAELETLGVLIMALTCFRSACTNVLGVCRFSEAAMHVYTCIELVLTGMQLFVI